MPLLDHFHPPLLRSRRRGSFHALWAGSILEDRNLERLPEGYFAEIQAHVGSWIEVAIGTFDEDHGAREPQRPEEASSSVATLVPRRRSGRPRIAGLELPTMPLPLKDGPCLPLELEATYARAGRRARLA